MNNFMRSILGPASFPRMRKQTPSEILETAQKPVTPSVTKPVVNSPIVNKEPDNGLRK